MNKDFVLPDIGEGIVECQILEWKVKEGDLIEEDQVVADVSTDKAIVEIPSVYSGRVTKLHYSCGDVAAVHSVLFSIETDDEFAKDEKPTIEELPIAPVELVKSQPTPKSEQSILTTPAVRKLAREHQLDLKQISGSGKSGRILKEDIQSYLSEQKADALAPVVDISADSTEAIVGVRKIMALKMSEAVTTIPHFAYVDEVDVTELVGLRSQLKSEYAEIVNITLMPLFIKSLSLALVKYPIMNSRVDDAANQITYLGNHNVGMAVDGKTGLLVPNIKHVQKLSILSIAQEVDRLTQAARGGVINPGELKGGTITLSNIGAIGGVSAAPIINKPEVAIAALGKIQKLPRFDASGHLQERKLMTVSWSGDHRVIDGATIARFNNCWKSYLENPVSMLATLT
ncbi:2-oxo acid dehydrogenase subunit E2 [Porticoccaceae bacterium]|nr:2-oxo acid dehydrogenase subunit E2 [Porticoccaceae bacterium]MDA8652052.1 2-oxo acid dehydrogenase subunit E2 [Porticoccaceae bacterium]MDA8788730.1 2-oxo acid dehydrogenase subunit E2 [Porticoccaceae bacterium]MDB2343953.1 2-oxo acid dehydrogenase subunit E2 [Porticoccaceae bacterium]MDB2634315.1 2-oxo acid dehydrogenase subunit E2 [Porticoccaceae bacterium]